MVNSSISDDFEKDFATLARLATAQSHDDVRLLLARLIRKYRQRHPELAAELDLSLRSSQTRAHSGASTALRRGGASQTLSPAPTELPIDQDSRLSLIKIFDDVHGIEPPLLAAPLLQKIESIILERGERDRLLARGIAPTKSAILVGPPGLGKTLSARWIAHRLGKPLWVLDLTAVMSSLLGKTGNNLRAAMDHAKQHEAILLLDEIDAIAKRRSDESDIGELKRLVTVILQEVDQWPDTGLLLAATNHPEIVDPALWRRFDAVLEFTLPDEVTTALAVERYLGADAVAFRDWILQLTAGLRGKSLSDVERTINGLRRANALLHKPASELVQLAIGQEKPVELTKGQRMELAIRLAKAGQLTHQEINRLTGVARDTIRKHAGPSPRRGRGMK